MGILLIQDDSQDGVSDKLSFSIDSSYNTSITQVEDLKKASEALSQTNHAIDLIICDYYKEPFSELEIFLENYKNIPLIYCEDKSKKKEIKKTWNILDVVDKNSLIVNLLKSLHDLNQNKKIKLEVKDSPQSFCKIKTELLLSVCPLKGDVYIRLSDTKYVKLFRQGDHFDKEDMQKYTEKKGVEYLYLKKVDCNEFIDKYNADLEERLRSKKPLDLGEMAIHSDSVFDTVQELGLQLGFNKNIQSIAKSHIQMTMKSMGKSPSLSGVLSKLDSFQGKYISSHSTLTGFMACALASQMEWGSETTFHKLSLAAFLHDIVFDNHKLAACETLADVMKGSFSPDEIRQYKMHPIQVAEYVKNFQEIPPDVDTIIIQHHELPNGEGFPRGIFNKQIAPLSAVFIVAHDISHHALQSGLGKEYKVNECIDALRAKYTTSQFKKVLDAAQKL